MPVFQPGPVHSFEDLRIRHEQFSAGPALYEADVALLHYTALPGHAGMNTPR